MKKILFIVLACSIFGCKKEVKLDNITAYHWVLTTAVVSPAMMVNNKAETNYLAIAGEPCLKYNYTLSFSDNGVYAISANGPLCDMAANNNQQKWSRTENTITLNDGYGTTSQLTFDGNNLIATRNMSSAGVNYKIALVYMPKSK